jgi:hypothetical protein
VVRGGAVGEERLSERAELLDIDLALVGLHWPTPDANDSSSWMRRDGFD